MNKFLHIFYSLGWVGLVFVLIYFPQKAFAACNLSMPSTAAEFESLLRGPIDGKLYHGDLGKSVELPNGKLLWVFGDTMIGSSGATTLTTGIHNSGLLTENSCVTALTGPLDSNGKETTWITPNATTDVPNLDDYYWASTPFMDGSIPRMFLSHMYNDASGFHNIGVDLATFSMDNDTPAVQNIVQTPGSANGNTAPSWGAGVYSDSSYLYIFGSIYRNEPWVWGHEYYLARTESGNGSITTPSNWRYWDGTDWVASQSAAAIIVPGTAGVGSGITVYKKSNGQYIMITKKFGMIGTDIIALTASSLTGPWTEVSPALLTIPALNPPMSNSDYTYLGLGHPEVTLGSGKLLVNWSVGSFDESTLGNPRSGIYLGEVDQP